MTHRDMWLEAHSEDSDYWTDIVPMEQEWDMAELQSLGIGEADVMHPPSFLSRVGFSDGSIGITPVFPLSARYMAGWDAGRAIWYALVADAYGA